MQILVAHMSAECNEHISHIADLNEFLLLYNDECIEAMHIREVFEKHNVSVIPAIFADLAPNGMIKKEAYEVIADVITEKIQANLDTLDGIYLQLHGASGILGLHTISGEYDLIKRIRNITGKHMPIAVVMDPHGNLTKKFAKQVNIIRCYRESPHSDQIECEQLVAEMMIDLLNNQRCMNPIVRKLPIMVGGERSVSAYEPMRTINMMLDNAEKDPRVLSCSYHVGYIRHDDDTLGAAVTVIPNTPNDMMFCEHIADVIAEYAWMHRYEFQFHGNYDEPDIALQKALKFEGKAIDGKTAVISDSGDNCGAGGYGQNTVMLQECLKQNLYDKHILIAGINDIQAHRYLQDKQIGDAVSFSLGIGEDELSKPVEIEGTLYKIGNQVYGLTQNQSVGKAFTIRLKDRNIDIIILDHNVQYGTLPQFEQAGVNFHDYDIVIVKMGYLDTYLIPETAYHIMALTDGPTNQRSEHIIFKKIFRPMWPIDDIHNLIYIE